jgi:hypothetical protein
MAENFDSRGQPSRATTGWMYAEYAESAERATVYAAALTGGAGRTLGHLVRVLGGAIAPTVRTGLLLTGAAAPVLDRWIPIEARHLRRMHGAAYDEYAVRTERWLDASQLRSGWRTGQSASH